MTERNEKLDLPLSGVVIGSACVFIPSLNSYIALLIPIPISIPLILLYIECKVVAKL